MNPVTGDQGRYRVTNGNSDVSEHCSEWNSGFIVHEVIEQWTPENDVIVTSEIESESAENIGELIIPATAVVVSTSLAITLFSFHPEYGMDSYCRIKWWISINWDG